MLHDLKVATIFLTRLPLRLEGTIAMRDLAGAAAFFPVVGVGVGLVGGLAFWLADGVGLDDLAGAIIAVAAMIVVTGALHEDGLADTADAWGAGADRERALVIMQDSRIGAFGALALLFAVLGRIAAVEALDEVWTVALALVGAAALSRAVLPMIMLLQPSARADGLAAGAGRPGPARALTALGVGLAIALLAAPALSTLPVLLVALAVAAVLAIGLGARFGGCTGDTLGAVQQVAEVTFLLALCADA